MIDSLETCNACDRPIKIPNPFGYCDECLEGLVCGCDEGTRLARDCPIHYGGP